MLFDSCFSVHPCAPPTPSSPNTHAHTQPASFLHPASLCLHPFFTFPAELGIGEMPRKQIQVRGGVVSGEEGWGWRGGLQGLVTHHDWSTALQSLGGLTAAAGPLASCPPLVHQLAPKLIF